MIFKIENSKESRWFFRTDTGYSSTYKDGFFDSLSRFLDNELLKNPFMETLERKNIQEEI